MRSIGSHDWAGNPCRDNLYYKQNDPNLSLYDRIMEYQRKHSAIRHDILIVYARTEVLKFVLVCSQSVKTASMDTEKRYRNISFWYRRYVDIVQIPRNCN